MEMAHLSGPLFQGNINGIVDDWVQQNLEFIGVLAVDAVRSELDMVLQNPTGYYRSHIRSDVRGSTVHVDDSGVIYGPWLAGTGSRNSPVTRFKGYNHWRRASQRIEELAPRTMTTTLPQLVRKMN